MPNHPSLMGLSNRVSLYRFLGTQDDEGGLALNPYGAALATSVPCSVQPEAPLRFLDDKTGRIIEKTPYSIMFATDYSLVQNDKVVWVDDAGVTRNLFVFGTANQAGKAGAFVVTAEERR